MAAIGVRKRAGGIFTREVADGFLGWVGLNTATRGYPKGVEGVHPVLGVRHQALERALADLRGEKFHPYVPPTLSIPLYELIPGSGYVNWVVDSAEPEASAAQIAEAVRAYGLPFMESKASLPAICDALDEGLGVDQMIAYSRPLACLMTGETARAKQIIEELEAGLGARDDAAARQTRAYFQAFRDRLLTE